MLCFCSSAILFSTSTPLVNTSQSPHSPSSPSTLSSSSYPLVNTSPSSHLPSSVSVPASSSALSSSTSPLSPVSPVPLAPRLSLFGSFLSGAISAVCACTITNPMDLIKTRLQLQGEAGSKSRQYRNVFHAFSTIFKQEGVRGLQRGLLPALSYQTLMNGSRLGFYEPIQRSIRNHVQIDADSSVLKMLSGALSGMIGATLGNPMYLVKNRLQSQSLHFECKEVYAYKGTFDGLSQVIRADGFRGLARGLNGSIPRVAVGSSTQLTSYDFFKAYALEAGLSNGFTQQLVSGLLASVVTVTTMNPFDVVATRLFQSSGKQTVYTGPIDCALKLVKTEGVGALQKGWTAQLARLAPMTVISLVLLENVRSYLVGFPKLLEQ